MCVWGGGGGGSRNRCGQVRFTNPPSRTFSSDDGDLSSAAVSNKASYSSLLARRALMNFGVQGLVRRRTSIISDSNANFHHVPAFLDTATTGRRCRYCARFASHAKWSANPRTLVYCRLLTSMAIGLRSTAISCRGLPEEWVVRCRQWWGWGQGTVAGSVTDCQREPVNTKAWDTIETAGRGTPKGSAAGTQPTAPSLPSSPLLTCLLICTLPSALIGLIR